MLPVIVGMTFVVFFMIHLVPGDPARTLLGPRASEEAIAVLHERWGLDRPLHEQFVSYAGGLLRGDLGTSLRYNVPTTDLLSGRFVPTLMLLAAGTFFTILISVPMAMTAALNEGRTPDHVVRVVPMIGLGMPAFWLGLMLLVFVALRVPWLPVGGFGSTFDQHLLSMVLPGLTVAFSVSPFVIRSLRASMIEVMASDFIATARAKGIPARRTLFSHGLRNAIIPAVTVLGVSIGWLVGNTLVVESVFALPGLGALMIDSVMGRDFAVVQSLALIFGLLVVIVNLVADVVRAWLDPRVELA